MPRPASCVKGLRRQARWLGFAMFWAVAAVTLGCGRPSTPPRPLRPLGVGVFEGYRIEPCETQNGPQGHVVRLTRAVDEAGEAASRERVESYRDRYLLPALAGSVRVLGWWLGARCARGGLVLFADAKQPEAYGEALHRIGETLRDHPTDIEVVLVLADRARPLL